MEQTFVKQTIALWEQSVKRVTDTFKGFSEEAFQADIAPGRNRPVYMLGHLVAVHDRMLPLLGLGARNWPELDAAFIRTPDRTVADIPSTADLLARFDQVNAQLAAKFAELTPAQWLEKHADVSAEDFAKEPHRNRFNVLLGRTSHIAYHQGQLVWAKK
ncbi:hypothetical protein DCC81_20190 [Chitinophaga parva]|uniref:DinB-like domain-containing protein n=1 Tax=Chitinophaga parva TaxID=2169414 RepID=A0A2T7BCC7_9BACT|nr:DinB family protein [Chitinophaga parva]PUZ22751.1 hypothetical protein DCC81_20190 [Chitinophaga parva]